MNYNLLHTMNEPCYVIIPNWNGIDMIEECLGALRRQTLTHTVIG